MNDIAITCDSLSKQYRIGERESYKALRDVISDAAAAPFRRLRSAINTNGNGSSIRNAESEIRNSFWALQDVSFEVKRGEVMGIIGRNGAGKSTLLKILSRITKPTKGHAEIHGRVGSLLEVGTGFHPELTGRENIYLNAAILGMRKAEVAKKFDEIVAFAEVEKFIDTPVKRYSSGMYVRLAFAVAAHMETEVLLVDEVLAVGDAQFQKKCLGKMGEVAMAGRTVLFVSHNMAAVRSLCSRAILLDGGAVREDGPCAQAIETHLELLPTNSVTAVIDLSSHPNRYRGCTHIFSGVTIKNLAGTPTFSFFPGDDIVLEFSLDPPTRINEPTLGIGVDNALGVRVFSVSTYFAQTDWKSLEGPTTVRCVIPQVALTPGRYSINVSVGTLYNTLMDGIELAGSFNIEPNDYFGTGRVPSTDLGVTLMRSEWEFQELQKAAKTGATRVSDSDGEGALLEDPVLRNV